MISNPHFYAVIIGTEILNGRRDDKHFTFLRDALTARGHALHATFVIKDSPALLRETFAMIKKDPQSVIFSFGGIGSTPDDLTREIAAEIFTCKPLTQHERFAQDIVARFGDEAYPHRILMSHLPQSAELLYNPVNNMSGFYLQERFFFVPGFPKMAHPMINEALERFYPTAKTLYRYTLYAHTSENTLIDTMKCVDKSVELSSLPVLVEGKAYCEISVASTDNTKVQKAFSQFETILKNSNITYELR